MSFKTELKIEDNTYTLNAFSLNIKQTVDEVGRPSSDTKGGKILIMLDSLDDAALMDWVTSDNKTMDGTITLFKADEESKLKEIKFEKGYCISLSEHFDGTSSGQNMEMSLIISAEKLSIGSIEVDNDWV